LKSGAIIKFHDHHETSLDFNFHAFGSARISTKETNNMKAFKIAVSGERLTRATFRRYLNDWLTAKSPETAFVYHGFLSGKFEQVFAVSRLAERMNLSAVESKPASGGRIKTSRFFPLNRWEMFWQESELRFFEQSGGNELGFDGFQVD
jgi:hypothetical protein